MPYTQADIDALRARIKTFAGVSSSKFGDQSTDFDMDAALKLLAIMEGEIAAATGNSRTRFAATSKGF